MPAASCRNQDSGSTRLQVGKSIEPRYVITPPAPVGNVRSVGQAADQHSHHPRMQRAWDSAHSLGLAGRVERRPPLPPQWAGPACGDPCLPSQ